ncbi:MAG TPA: carboxymuconolactone decarboxylase family protein [Streptosporangiaceae bacterium]|jgi:4-carboxymuconolactone decarboxylase
MSRLHDLRRDQLSREGQAVWDAIVATRGEQMVTEAGALRGPFNAFVHAPAAGRPLSELGAALRFGTSFGRRLTETAIITVASRWQAEFEWAAHAQIAREAGVPADVVAAIGRGEEPAFAAEDERVVYAVAFQLTRAGQVSQESYDAARDLLGDAGLVELVSLCGYYTVISYLLNAFAVPPPPGVAPMWSGSAAATAD